MTPPAGFRPVGRRGVIGAALLACLLCGCVAPAFDTGAYERNAIRALYSAVSDARTGALALETLLDDRLTRPYADTVVTESEEAVGPVEDSFGSVDPPSAADVRLRDEVGGLLSDTSDALADARIALRRDDRGGMRGSMAQLRALADRMEARSERLA
jgi:hypothetical protein